MSLGEKISQARKAKSLSQETLAEMAGVTARTIQRIENNASKPRPFTLQQISQVLEIPIEKLTTSPPLSQPSVLQNDPWLSIRLINLSVLGMVLFPLSNVLFPLLIWRKNKHLLLVNELGKKIISFQVLWTAATLLFLIIVPLLLFIVTGSVAVGRFPLPLFTYLLLLITNLFFTIQTARRIQAQQTHIYPFVPVLF